MPQPVNDVISVLPARQIRGTVFIIFYWKIAISRYSWIFEVILTVHRRYYVEIKCQLDATNYIYCRFYCILNMFRAILCPSSGAREYYTDGRCLWYLVLWFSGCWYGVELEVMCPVCRLLFIHGSSSCKNAHQMLRLYISFMPAFHLIWPSWPKRHSLLVWVTVWPWWRSAKCCEMKRRYILIIKNRYTYYHKPQYILSIPSTAATCFGRIDRLQ